MSEKSKNFSFKNFIILILLISLLFTSGYIFWLKLPTSVGASLTKEKALQALTSIAQDFGYDPQSALQQNAFLKNVYADSKKTDLFYPDSVYKNDQTIYQSYIAYIDGTSSSLIDQYHQFLFEPYLIQAVCQNSMSFKINETFNVFAKIGSPEPSVVPTALGHCYEENDQIIVEFYSWGVGTELGGFVKVKIVVDYDFNTHAYRVQFLFDINGMQRRTIALDFTHIGVNDSGEEFSRITVFGFNWSNNESDYVINETYNASLDVFWDCDIHRNLYLHQDYEGNIIAANLDFTITQTKFSELYNKYLQAVGKFKKL